MATRSGSEPLWRDPNPLLPRPLQAVVVAVALAGATVSTVHRRWAFDVWSYLAAITEFKHAGLAASHPLAINGGADPFLSP